MVKRLNGLGSRFLSILLMLGGLMGIGISLYLGYTYVQQHWVYVVLIAAFFSLFAWTTLTGFRLWRDDHRGWRWAQILYAAQIPVFTIPGLSYEYYAGIALKVLGGQVDSNFSMALGANANFYLDTRITDVVYGVNLFAVGAFVYLIVGSRSIAVSSIDAQEGRSD